MTRRAAALIAFSLALAGCFGRASLAPSDGCDKIAGQMKPSDPIVTLNSVGQALYTKCYGVALKYGSKARERFGRKIYSVSRETAGILLPDGTLTEYALESYERSYLSVVLAASYLGQKKTADAQVELRRLDQELVVRGYNFGEDPVNTALSAALWERTGQPSESRVDWLRLSDETGELAGLGPEVRSFAASQVARIDREPARRASWRVFGVGDFPDALWSVEPGAQGGNYYSIKPRTDFAAECRSDTGLRISTRSWFEKLARRYDADNHPVQNAQSWLRLPVATAYSVVPAVAGAGLAAGGCALGAVAAVKTKAGPGGGIDVCGKSIETGSKLMDQAPRLWHGVVKPDLRHWDYLPAAFVLTTAASLREEPCSRGLVEKDLAEAVEL